MKLKSYNWWYSAISFLSIICFFLFWPAHSIIKSLLALVCKFLGLFHVCVCTDEFVCIGLCFTELAFFIHPSYCLSCFLFKNEACSGSWPQIPSKRLRNALRWILGNFQLVFFYELVQSLLEVHKEYLGLFVVFLIWQNILIREWLTNIHLRTAPELFKRYL